jgi:hypothetical protein
MSLVSHFIAFSLGAVCSLVGVVVLFYWVLLKRIQKNESVFTEPLSKQVESAGDPFADLHRVNSLETEERKDTLSITTSADLKKQLSSPPLSSSIDKESKKDDQLKATPQERKEKDKQSKPVDPIQKAIQSKLSTNSPSKSVSTPSAPVTPNTKSTIPHLSVTTPGSLNLTQSIDEPLKMGWVKMRGFHVWWNRWAVLRAGKLIYYRNEKVCSHSHSWYLPM